MATFLNNKVGFKVATVDLSAYVQSFVLNRVVDQIEITAMGDTSHKYATGLSADTITVTFLNNDAASGAGSVRATLQAAFGSTVAFSAIQDTSAAVSSTNPIYTGTILVDNLTDINAPSPADIATFDITFTCNSKTAPATTGTWA
jgi:hypothetical protein